MHWRGFQFAAAWARMRAHAQKAQREKAHIWGRAKRRTVENKKARPFFCMHARLRRGRAKGKRLALFSLQSVNKSVNRRDRKSPRNVGSTGFLMEQMMGIEPTQPAWEAGVLPLNYICTN